MRDEDYIAGLSKVIDRVDKEVEPTRIRWPFKRVLNNHLVVQINEFRYSGKLIVPDSAKRKPTTGTVVAKADNITDIEVGDKILFSQFAGTLLKFDGIPLCRVISYEEIIAPLNADAPELESESA
jgi:co-chaperonin GroES (HSP10)